MLEIRQFQKRLWIMGALLCILTGCDTITDNNQTFAIHTGSVSGDPCQLTDCSAERDKHKWYVIETPGKAMMLDKHGIPISNPSTVISPS